MLARERMSHSRLGSFLGGKRSIGKEEGGEKIRQEEEKREGEASQKTK
jgi:hypothetical protein